MPSIPKRFYAGRSTATEREMVIEIPGAQGASVFIFAGPSLKEAIQRYNPLFRPAGVVPPRWALGIWYRTRGDFDQKQVEQFAKDLREEQMPCDVPGP